MQKRQRNSIIGMGVLVLFIAGAIILLLWLNNPGRDDEIPIPTLRQTEVVVLPSPTGTFTLPPPTSTPAPTFTITPSPSSLPPTITPSPQPTIIPETPLPDLPPLPAPVEIALGISLFGESGIPPTYGRFGGLYDNQALINAGHVMIVVPGSGASFYIDTFEVTNLQLVNFLNATQLSTIPLEGFSPDARWIEDSQSDSPLIQDELGTWRVRSNRFEMLPARYVSALTARAYCHNIGAALPTLEQWQQAAFMAQDAGGKRPFPWGDAFPNSTYANFNSGELLPRDTLERGRSWVGAFHMGGNVAEWVQVDEKTFGLIGGSFMDDVTTFSEAVQNVKNMDGSHPQPDSGFRCARGS